MKVLNYIINIFDKFDGENLLYKAICIKEQFVQLRTLGANWTRQNHQLLYIEDNGNGYTISFYDINDNLEKEINLDYSQLEYLRIAAHVLDTENKTLKKYLLQE